MLLRFGHERNDLVNTCYDHGLVVRATDKSLFHTFAKAFGSSVKPKPPRPYASC